MKSAISIPPPGSLCRHTCMYYQHRHKVTLSCLHCCRSSYTVHYILHKTETRGKTDESTPPQHTHTPRSIFNPGCACLTNKQLSGDCILIITIRQNCFTTGQTALQVINNTTSSGDWSRSSQGKRLVYGAQTPLALSAGPDGSPGDKQPGRLQMWRLRCHRLPLFPAALTLLAFPLLRC